MNFRYYRKRAKLTLQEVGDAIGVSSTAVFKWEDESDGKKNLPRSDKLPDILKLYNCSLDELLSDEEPKGQDNKS